MDSLGVIINTDIFVGQICDHQFVTFAGYKSSLQTLEYQVNQNMNSELA